MFQVKREGGIDMRKTFARILALALAVVMVICSPGGLRDGNIVYADTELYSDSVDTATPGDGRIDASQFDIKLMSENVHYTGDEICLWLNIRDRDGKGLSSGSDYTVSYTDNIFPGTAKIKVIYKGRYKGIAEKTFKITPAQVDGLKAVDVQENSVVLDWEYTDVIMDRYVVMQCKDGKWQQVFSCDASGEGADLYKLTSNTVYKYCVKGQYKLASGKYVDVAKSSVITVRTKPYSADCTTIKMSKKTFAYDGTEKKPAFKVIGINCVTVDPKNEYTYAYANNLYPGTATLKVKYAANSRYKGSRTEKFKIVPAKIGDIKSKQTANSITLTFPAIKGATEYRVYGTDHDFSYPYAEKYKVVGRSKTTTITIKNRKQASEYSFYIRAYAVKDGKEIMLAKSDSFIKRTPPAKITGVVSGRTEKIGSRIVVQTGPDYVEIGCTPVPRADGYYIYRYDPKSKKWIKILYNEGDNYDKKTNKVYFMIENLKPGTCYMFKIAACRSRWTSLDSKGELVGEKSQSIKVATVHYTKYRYVYTEKLKNSSQLNLNYKVKLGGCSKNKGYYIILNKVYIKSGDTVCKPYKIIKTNKSTSIVNVDVPIRTSRNDPYYRLSVKTYIEYGGKIFVGRENFQYGGNMK